MTNRSSPATAGWCSRVVRHVLLPLALASVVLGCSSADEAFPSTPDATAPDEGEPDGSVPDGSVPDATVPDGSVPDDSVPVGSVPDGSVPDESGPSTPNDPPVNDAPDGEPGEGASAPDDDSDSDPLLFGLALVGFGILLGVAMTWMLRRDDPDREVGAVDTQDRPDEQMSI